MPTSSRCTMPCRSAAPLVAMVYPAASSPPSTVGPVQPGRGMGGHPDRLVHHHDVVVLVDHLQAGHRLGGTGGGGPGRAASPRATPPPCTRSDLARGRAADQYRRPSAIRSAAPVRDSPNIRASAASSARRPARRAPARAALGLPERRRPAPWRRPGSAGPAARPGGSAGLGTAECRPGGRPVDVQRGRRRPAARRARRRRRWPSRPR